MPICVSDQLPAIQILRQENIFVMPASRANQQNIRPLRVLLLNLMPKKIETEIQFIRLLSNTALQVDIKLVRIDLRESKNTPAEHLNSFYCQFDDIKDENFDGLIITGAPLEFIDFEQISYWQQLKTIIQWSKTHITSTLFVCWAAQAALSLLYDVPRLIRKEKLSGIYWHQTMDRYSLLTRGFDEHFWAPHSRYIDFPEEIVKQYTDLHILAQSSEVGCYLMASADKRRVFVTGHPEYDATTLLNEYLRDQESNLSPLPPVNYFPDNDPAKQPKMVWRSHAHLLFANWLNYFVYQITPFDLTIMNPTLE